MNIKQAKQYIGEAVRLYLKRDELGEYRIPVVRQRPIFLLGAPGIGKTAVMEQIAQEMGLALVSYSMTHHTRQSALGLPFITQKNYDGYEINITEYTMSEIIASIYDIMEQSGLREGILFLDEINCVSETLAPSMLQFLQYKTFGRHRVPDGWIIVTAGNPPEYNKSVREFDVVTMDRLKVLEVEPDYGVWREYASEHGVHPAVLGFLDLKKEAFYLMEMTAKGRSFVTARGWEDFSAVLFLYEEEGLAVTEELVGQYLHSDRVVREFAAYYELFHKYKRDYHVNDILAGHPAEQAVARARSAPFDERLSLLGLLMDRVTADMKEVMERTDDLSELVMFLKVVKGKADESDPAELAAFLEVQGIGRRKRMENLQSAGALSEAERRRGRRIVRFLEEGEREILRGDVSDGAEAFAVLKRKYDAELAETRAKSMNTQDELHALFEFTEQAFGEEDGTPGNEMLVLVTQLTANSYAARFLAAFGSDDYRKYSQELMLSERSAQLRDEVEAALTELQL